MAQVNDSFTVMMLKKGDTPTIWLESTPPLYQGVSPDGLQIAPDWNIAGNQPVIRPKILSSLRGTYIQIVPETDEWSYNDQKLTFDAAGNVTAPAAHVGKFKRDKAAGTLRILKNLASAVNKDPDTIKFEGVIDTGGTTTKIAHTARIQIEEVSGSVYRGIVSLTSTAIDTIDAVITATARLFSGPAELTTGWTAEWWEVVPVGEDNDGVVDGWKRFKTTSGKTTTITAVDVNGKESFRCDFKAGDKVVDSFYFDIYDTQDPYHISLPFKEKHIGVGESAESTPRLVDRKTGAVVAGATYSFQHYDTLGALVSLNTPIANNKVVITYADLEKKNAQGNERGAIKTYVTGTKL